MLVNLHHKIFKMKILSIISCLLFIKISFCQVTITPSTIKSGTETVVSFSGGPINISNGTCIEVYLKSGTTTILQTASAVYYQASNTLVASFYVASNTISGLYDVIFYDFCNNTIIATYTKKMSVSVSSILNVISSFFSISPNPVEKGQVLDILTSDIESKSNSLSIYDINGKLVYTKAIITEKETIPTQTFNAGIYFVQIVNEKGHKISKKIEVK